VLYNFFGLTDGANPYGGLVQASNGLLYGLAYDGGASNNGALYSISMSGTFSYLYPFSGYGTAPDYCQGPFGSLIQGTDGYLYGTTVNGGGSLGNIFNIRRFRYNKSALWISSNF
jgi:uncharacterized repeat protein (TIGR03803 family)